MAIIKEYQSSEVETRGPGNWNGQPWEVEKTCILRGASLTELYNAAGADKRLAETGVLTIVGNRVEFSTTVSDAELEAAGYTKLPPKTIGARG